jgi:hypothetical protein
VSDNLPAAPADAGADVVEAEPVDLTHPKVAEIVHPRTGEIVDVSEAPTTLLADLRDAIVEHEGIEKLIKARLDAEIARRLDHENTRSAQVGDWKLTVQGPTKVQWNGRVAYNGLRQLVRRGLISDEAARRCVTRTVDYSVAHGELQKLGKHAHEDVRAVVEQARETVDVERRRVSVTRQVRP